MHMPRTILSRTGGTVILAALAVGSAVAAGADQKPPTRVKVFCYVEEDPSGFVDQRVQDIRDSLKDLTQAIAKKKDWLELVEGPFQADIVVQVVERRIDPSGRFEASSTGYTDKSGKYVSGTARSREIMLYVVRAVMGVGDYKSELIGSVQDTYIGGLWKAAAGDVAGQLEKWVKTNYTKLMIDKVKRDVRNPRGMCVSPA